MEVKRDLKIIQTDMNHVRNSEGVVLQGNDQGNYVKVICYTPPLFNTGLGVTVSPSTLSQSNNTSHNILDSFLLLKIWLSSN